MFVVWGLLRVTGQTATIIGIPADDGLTQANPCLLSLAANTTTRDKHRRNETIFAIAYEILTR
jgi:hypothetical protein